MYLRKKIWPLCAAATSLIFVTLLRYIITQDLSHGFFSDLSKYPGPRGEGFNQGSLGLGDVARGLSSNFRPGSPKPPTSNYSRVMVVPHIKEEDIKWMADELPDMNISVYVADDPSAYLHPPRNKGHEVMVYLTYIIDHYDSLPDIVLFMHAHRWTHHNNEFLGHDAVEMIRRLNNAHVIRNGYMNMRCHWGPGCPEWLHPVSTQELLGKQEEKVLSKCWSELFPLEPMPTFLAQPCCAQFALSKERLLAIPLGRYVFYRDWILRTPLSDYISGRIWEYSWQFVFTGQNVYCPAEHTCYCDGFGICFGGKARYKDFLELRNTKQGFESELEDWRDKKRIFEEAARSDNVTGLPAPDRGRHTFLNEQIEALNKEMAVRKQNAMERGDNPKYRAEECGRRWKKGDGF